MFFVTLQIIKAAKWTETVLRGLIPQFRRLFFLALQIALFAQIFLFWGMRLNRANLVKEPWHLRQKNCSFSECISDLPHPPKTASRLKAIFSLLSVLPFSSGIKAKGSSTRGSPFTGGKAMKLGSGTFSPVSNERTVPPSNCWGSESSGLDGPFR